MPTIYKPSGKALKVNRHMVNCLKNGDPALAGWTLKKPEAKKPEAKK